MFKVKSLFGSPVLDSADQTDKVSSSDSFTMMSEHLSQVVALKMVLAYPCCRVHVVHPLVDFLLPLMSCCLHLSQLTSFEEQLHALVEEGMHIVVSGKLSLLVDFSTLAASREGVTHVVPTLVASRVSTRERPKNFIVVRADDARLGESDWLKEAKENRKQGAVGSSVSQVGCSSDLVSKSIGKILESIPLWNCCLFSSNSSSISCCLSSSSSSLLGFETPAPLPLIVDPCAEPDPIEGLLLLPLFFCLIKGKLLCFPLLVEVSSGFHLQGGINLDTCLNQNAGVPQHLLLHGISSHDLSEALVLSSFHCCCSSLHSRDDRWVRCSESFVRALSPLGSSSSSSNPFLLLFCLVFFAVSFEDPPVHVLHESVAR